MFVKADNTTGNYCGKPVELSSVFPPGRPARRLKFSETQMKSASLRAQAALMNILRAAINLSDAETPNSGMSFGVTPGWDSLGHVVLISEIERVIGREIPLDLVPELGRADRVLQLLEEHFSSMSEGA